MDNIEYTGIDHMNPFTDESKATKDALVAEQKKQAETTPALKEIVSILDGEIEAVNSVEEYALLSIPAEELAIELKANAQFVALMKQLRSTFKSRLERKS